MLFTSTSRTNRQREIAPPAQLIFGKISKVPLIGKIVFLGKGACPGKIAAIGP